MKRIKPEDFLTEKYIGGLADILYDNIKLKFIDLWTNYDKNKDKIILISQRRDTGKTTLILLNLMYVIYHVSTLSEVDFYKYFNFPKNTEVNCLIFGDSRIITKFIREYFINMLEKSTVFKKVIYHDLLHDNNYVYYTMRNYEDIQFNNITLRFIKEGNNIHEKIRGTNTIFSSFVRNVGLQFQNALDMYDRTYSRFANKFPSLTIVEQDMSFMEKFKIL